MTTRKKSEPVTQDELDAVKDQAVLNDEPMDTIADDVVRAFLGRIGRKGGAVSNKKKSDAVRGNLEKARAVKAHNDRVRIEAQGAENKNKGVDK